MSNVKWIKIVTNIFDDEKTHLAAAIVNELNNRLSFFC